MPQTNAFLQAPNAFRITELVTVAHLWSPGSRICRQLLIFDRSRGLWPRESYALLVATAATYSLHVATSA